MEEGRREREEGWRKGGRRVKVGLRELEGGSWDKGGGSNGGGREGGDIGRVGMRKGGREGWRVKKGGEGGSERGMGGGRREGRRDGEMEGGKEGRREGGWEPGRSRVTMQLVYHICIHLLNPHWPMPRQAVISTQQHKLSH